MSNFDKNHLANEESWRLKGARFVRYLSTRKMECWGFLAAGFLIAKIF